MNSYIQLPELEMKGQSVACLQTMQSKYLKGCIILVSVLAG